MEKIAPFQEKDKKAFEKLLRRLSVTEESIFLPYGEHPEFFEHPFTYILKEDGLVKSFASCSDKVLEALFPLSKKSMRLFDLYEEIGIGEERVIFINLFASDPGVRKNGYMSRLFSFLENTFKNVTWLCLDDKENEAARAFLLSHGFIPFMESDSFEGHAGKTMILYVNKLRRKGLASISF